MSIEEGMKKFSSFIHPEDIGLVREKWAESMRMKSDWKCEYRVIDQRTGNYRWFSGHTQPLINEEGEVSK